MGCRQLQLNNYFSFIDTDENPKNTFRFVGTDPVEKSSFHHEVTEENEVKSLFDGFKFVLTNSGNAFKFIVSDESESISSCEYRSIKSIKEGFTGEQFDPNLQMQYLRARYYDQNNGRFNRLDPFGGNNNDPQSLHKYAYTHCNPVMGIYPSGNMTLVSMQGAISIMMTVMSEYMYVAEEALKAIKSRFGESTALNMALSVIQIYQYVEIAMIAIMAIYLFTKIIVDLPKLYKFFVNLWKKIPEIINNLKKILTKKTLTPNQLGKIGEESVQAVYQIGEKVKIQINGRNRIPDGLTKVTLSEVKNVKRLSYTRQLRDFADFALDKELQFDLYVRPSTELSNPLLEAIKKGEISLHLIPGAK